MTKQDVDDYLKDVPLFNSPPPKKSPFTPPIFKRKNKNDDIITY
jgi:hypothetical protein